MVIDWTTVVYVSVIIDELVDFLFVPCSRGGQGSGRSRVLMGGRLRVVQCSWGGLL